MPKINWAKIFCCSICGKMKACQPHGAAIDRYWIVTGVGGLVGAMRLPVLGSYWFMGPSWNGGNVPALGAFVMPDAAGSVPNGASGGFWKAVAVLFRSKNRSRSPGGNV